MQRYSQRKRFQNDRRAVSPAISVTIITAATIIMVLVSSTYAYSALQRQQGASEFQAVQKSFQTFDDAVRDVAWDRASTRAIHFTSDFGFLEVVGNVPLEIQVREYPTTQKTYQTGYLRYNLSTNYLTFGDNYRSYFVGEEEPIITGTAEDVSQGFVHQEKNWINLYLTYRVRVLTEPMVAGRCYVDIMITKLGMSPTFSSQAGDFDILVKNLEIASTSHQFNSPSSVCNVDVTLDGHEGSIPVQLPSGTSIVVFNFIVATVQVTV